MFPCGALLKLAGFTVADDGDDDDAGDIGSTDTADGCVAAVDAAPKASDSADSARIGVPPWSVLTEEFWICIGVPPASMVVVSPVGGETTVRTGWTSGGCTACDIIGRTGSCSGAKLGRAWPFLASRREVIARLAGDWGVECSRANVKSELFSVRLLY